MVKDLKEDLNEFINEMMKTHTKKWKELKKTV